MRFVRLASAFIFTSLLFMTPHRSSAQSLPEPVRANADTITFNGLRANDFAIEMTKVLHTHIDTVIWKGQEGEDIFKYRTTLYGYPGEVRIETNGERIFRMTFSIDQKDLAGSKAAFEKLNKLLVKKYGDPDETYSNIYHNINWHGLQQKLELKFKDNTNYVSLVLSTLRKR